MQNNLNKNLNPAAVDKLMNAAAQKLGCSPAQLKAKLQSGELERSIKNGSAGELNGLAAILNDPAAINKLMNDPAAAQIINKLRNGR